MDQPSLYDDDIVTWAEQQAAYLRLEPSMRRRLNWDHI
ncbi:hypothetical protein OCOJLMKI_2198 [Methylobacterium iners]|jgi:hypothetical protein|uniref:DUF29 domain-containing protein n=1 Tax=Methylobacterium iners TaxID=418707 RepID=A0ABQ4RX67_9HYPH|nr:hypothetical protein OCOJLMKI_2198 [Methylobacterium iners]